MTQRFDRLVTLLKELFHKETDQTWTGQTIEDHFKRLMFEDPEEGVGAW